MARAHWFVFEVDECADVLHAFCAGNFAYGGSTMILLFPSGVVDHVIPEIGSELKMGQDLARIRRKESADLEVAHGHLEL